MAKSIEAAQNSITITLIGKYTGLQDSYLSVIKALRHATIACNVRLDLRWVEATLLEEDKNSPHGKQKENDETEAERREAWRKIETSDGVIIPGGFGQRGWAGKIRAANYCRLHNKPCLGVCLGFQAMIVEYCRNVLNWENADSTEFDESTPHPVVIFMPEIDKTTMGGTMRLGARITRFTHTLGDSSDPIKSSSRSQILYGGKETISERHRHRYEVNPQKVKEIHDAGLRLVGRDETGERMEIAELPDHIYYVGCQFHPEFRSRPLKPSPPFHGLILAATGRLEDHLYKTKNIPA